MAWEYCRSGRPSIRAGKALPDSETEQGAFQHLASVCSDIFEEQLNGSHSVPSAWSKERTLNAFLRSFDCSSIRWSYIGVTSGYGTATCNAHHSNLFWRLCAASRVTLFLKVTAFGALPFGRRSSCVISSKMWLRYLYEPFADHSGCQTAETGGPVRVSPMMA